jgi:N-acetylmuramoyl-L-alanine amidase
MRNLELYDTGEEVKILQALLKVTADGSFGKITQAALVKATATSTATDAVWKHFFYEPTKNPRLYVRKIPFTNISNLHVSLKDRNKTLSVLEHTNPLDNMAMNGVMFDMNTYQNVTDMVIQGVINNGGNYSNKGLQLAPNSVAQSTTWLSKGKPVDFIGGAPTLILNGVRDVDMKGLRASYYSNITQRIAVGCDATSLYIITTGQANKVSLEEVVQEGLFQSIKTLINLDGGGSTAQVINGQVCFSAGRNVPSALCLTVAPRAISTDMTHKITVVGIDIGHGGTDPGAIDKETKMQEKKINYNVGTHAKRLFEQEGIKVIITRDTDKYLSFVERGRIMNSPRPLPQIVFSIHHNSSNSPTAKGFEIIYNNPIVNKPLSKEISQYLVKEFLKLGQTQHGVFCKAQRDGQDWYGIQRVIKPPTIISEFAYLNSEDVHDIDTLTEQYAEAQGIVNAVLAYNADH